jgi:hypothetical protein
LEGWLAGAAEGCVAVLAQTTDAARNNTAAIRETMSDPLGWKPD